MYRFGSGMFLVNPFVYAGGPALDPDAEAFITAAAITDATQQSAIDTLVKDLKDYGIWTKMKAVYPFVGGTASTHKFNLKDPRDLDAAFRLVFNGGWTHSSNGAKPNGTNAYADTFFNPVTESLAYNDNHLGYYSRTSANLATSIYDIGSGNSTQGGTAMFLNRTSITQSAYDTGTAFSNRIGFTNTNGSGFFLGSSVGTKGIIMRNGSQQNSKDPLTNVAMQGYNFYIGGFNEGNTGITYYSNKEVAFASIGNGLTATEGANLYTAVQAFQVTLNRQIP